MLNEYKMKAKMKLGFGLLLTMVILLGFGFKGKTIKTEQYQKIDSKKVNIDPKITGNELFKNNCAACHGNELQGNLPTFPTLVNISQKYTKEQIGDLLKTGRNIMPNFSHLSELERTAIIGFLFGEFTEASIVTEISPVENGKNLFVANCARCHQPDAINSVSQKQMYMGMKPPVLNGVNKRVNINQFKQILNIVPCYMPSFAAMDGKNKEDIYAYLSSLESSYQNYNYRMKRGCGMMMHQKRD